MIIYLIFLESVEDGMSHGSIVGVSLSFKYAKEIALKYGKEISFMTPYIEMWDTSASRDGGDRIGRFNYNEQLKIFEFEEDD